MRTHKQNPQQKYSFSILITSWQPVICNNKLFHWFVCVDRCRQVCYSDVSFYLRWLVYKSMAHLIYALMAWATPDKPKFSHWSNTDRHLPCPIRRFLKSLYKIKTHKNVEAIKHIARHTAHTVVSAWPNPIRWLVFHISDLMMIIRRRTNILTIIKRKWVGWNTQRHILHKRRRHTVDRIHLTSIL